MSGLSRNRDEGGERQVKYSYLFSLGRPAKVTQKCHQSMVARGLSPYLGEGGSVIRGETKPFG